MKTGQLTLVKLLVIFAISGCTAFSFDTSDAPPTATPQDAMFLQDISEYSETLPSLEPAGLEEDQLGSAEGDISTLFEQSVVVRINGRWVSQNLVTNDQFELCVATGTCTPPNSDENPDFGDPYSAPYPVVGITLEQAQAYCEWLGGTVLRTSGYDQMKTSGKAGETHLFPKTQDGLDSIDIYLVDENGNPKLGSLQYFTDSDLPAYGSIEDLVDTSDIGFGCDIDELTDFTPMCEQVATISTTTGEFPPGVCATVGFDVNGTYCQNGKHYMNIDLFNAKEGFYTDPQTSCDSIDPNSEGTDVWKIYCSGEEGQSFTIGAYSQCTPPSGWQPNAACLSGYHFDEKAGYCIYDGSDLKGSGVCPDGYTLAPQTNCCAPAGDYPATCPVGTVQSGTWGGCTPYESTYELFTATATFEKCEGSTGGAPGGSSCSLACPSDCQPDPTCSVCQTSGGGSCKP